MNTTPMTPPEINVKLAEALGWHREEFTHRAGCWISPDGKTFPRSNMALPNYTGSYDAVMEEVEKLTLDRKEEFTRHLLKITRDSGRSSYCDCATANKLDRACALLATLTGG